MFKLVDHKTQKARAFCPVCGVEKKEEDLQPPFHEDKEMYDEV